ncbi:hypothetical protein P692DRAFT_201799195 [Suillus brevipes Sb2]|nr:hypothetical protein P692DRAFT_201799195 [Suillus brevipes Sb2]
MGLVCKGLGLNLGSGPNCGSTKPSGLPSGVGGKRAIGSSASRLSPATHRDILHENEARVRHNKSHTDHRATTTDVVDDDKDMLEVPPKEGSTLPEPRPINMDTPMINLFRGYNKLTPGSHTGFERLLAKAMAAQATPTAQPPVQPPAALEALVVTTSHAYSDVDVKSFTSFDEAFEIPRVIIDLANSHIHVPLTLLTSLAFQKIHTDPSCIKMRKGFLTKAAYERRWNDTIAKISQKKADEASANTVKETNRVTALAAHLEGTSSSSRYQPYPAGKPKNEGGSAGPDSKPFWKGKGVSTDGPLCLLCSRNGHKASQASQTHTLKNKAVVGHWKDKILLKSDRMIVCISFNIGKCLAPKHGPEFTHVCSVCRSSSHHTANRAC